MFNTRGSNKVCKSYIVVSDAPILFYVDILNYVMTYPYDVMAFHMVFTAYKEIAVSSTFIKHLPCTLVNLICPFNFSTTFFEYFVC